MKLYKAEIAAIAKKHGVNIKSATTCLDGFLNENEIERYDSMEQALFYFFAQEYGDMVIMRGFARILRLIDEAKLLEEIEFNGYFIEKIGKNYTVLPGKHYRFDVDKVGAK